MTKYKILILIGLILILVGFVIQQIVLFIRLGFMMLFALVPHWSLIFYVGIIPLVWGVIGGLLYED